MYWHIYNVNKFDSNINRTQTELLALRPKHSRGLQPSRVSFDITQWHKQFI